MIVNKNLILNLLEAMKAGMDGIRSDTKLVETSNDREASYMEGYREGVDGAILFVTNAKKMAEDMDNAY